MPECEFLKFVENILINQGCDTKVLDDPKESCIELITKKSGKKYGTLLVQSEREINKNLIERALKDSKMLDCCGTLVITNSFFSHEAKTLAEKEACKLVDVGVLSEWSAASSPPSA